MKQSAYLILLALVWACSNTKQTANESSETDMSTDESMSEAAPMAEDSAYVFFKHPQDGATVASPVYFEMGVSGMQIEPAGEVKEGYGHHHILINQASWPEGTVIPMSDSTYHYGKGQTDATLELPAGEYTISLQFADGVHSSYGPSMAASINITVE